MVYILDLAVETLIEIFSRLLFTDIFSCKQTCQTFLDVISNSTQLNYHVELQMSGMKDNPDCLLPVPVRLKMLKDRELAWATFNFKFITKVKIPYKPSGQHDVTAGIFLMGKAHPIERLTSDGIQSVMLPSAPDEYVPSKWKDVHLGAMVLDFRPAIGEHDLLACVLLVPDDENPSIANVKVILRNYSDTHKDHDAALMPSISVCSVNAQEIPEIHVEISGETLAIIVGLFADLHEPEEVFRLFLFDWKTGYNKTPIPIRVFNPGIVFLREDVLLQPNMKTGALDIYSIPRSSTDGDSNEVQHLLSLCFPSLNPGYFISYMTARCEPGTTSNSDFPKHTPKMRPYANDPAAAIAVILLEIHTPDNEERSQRLETDEDETTRTIINFVMIVHRKALLELVLQQPEGNANKETKLPWDVWGPPITRWFEVGSFEESFNTDSFGQRYVQLINRAIHIFDFNPSRVKLMAKHGRELLAERDLELRVIHEDSRIIDLGQRPENAVRSLNPERDVFTGVPAGALPFVQVISTGWPETYDGLLIDEERLLAVLTEDDPYIIESMDVIYIG
ncbi:hypothetical protein GALMADRAFT_278639 [Galerina marginata CBS 339.88]|uniref:F-box domain-containing protein n=1 Tax=Galerina marginata (strain CBS 339.88) TaxID=685588 RepID=A0A067T2M4_GALM3|nr:hypothetical protein GALMADRAFT_278639 [Galerina marginata CBS 339.88]